MCYRQFLNKENKMPLESQNIFCIMKIYGPGLKSIGRWGRDRKTGEHTVEEKNTCKLHKKRFLFLICVLFLAVCALFFSMRKYAVQESEAVSLADFFAYTDRENRLYVWREGSSEPLLLTDCAFAVQGEEPGLPYWEAWEYWQEWDETNGVWIRNEEKALQDVIWETPGQNLLFPENMRWTTFGMYRGAKERREALAYMDEKELEEQVKVRVFCYDLYLQDSDVGQEAKKLAENVLFYSVDEKGAVWYCQAAVDKTEQVQGEELPCASCILYRYDGTEHQKIGEIDGRRKDPYRVEKGGNQVIFYGMDGGLYGCRPGEEPGLLAEGVDRILSRDDRSESLIYTRDGSVCEIREGKAETELYAGGESRQSVGGLGREGNVLIVLEAAEHVRYSDWIAPDGREEDEDTIRLWELLEETECVYYPLLCTVRVMDFSASPAKTIDEVSGYMIMGPTADEEGSPKDVYYMEMMPEDSFEKIPLSELLGDSLPGDVLYSCNYYLSQYGENYADQAFAWGLEACWEQEAFEKRSSVYAVTKSGIYPLEELNGGMILGTSEDYSADGTLLYLLQYQSPDMEQDYRKYGHHRYYGYLENRYMLDGGGSCRKVVELADETAVVGNEVFYSRNMGLEGYVSLYGSGHEEAIASAADISLESLQKSPVSDTCLFLAEGLMTAEEETIPVYAQSDLKKTYQQLDISQDWFSDEKNLHTLVQYREGTVRELETDIYSFAFYGKDSVWMLQYREDEDSATEEDGRAEEENGRAGSLFICENEKKQKITDQAVWIVKAGSGEGNRSASWVME